MEGTKLPTFIKFAAQRNQIFVAMGGHETGRPGAKRGGGRLCPRPGPKTATGNKTVQRCELVHVQNNLISQTLDLLS